MVDVLRISFLCLVVLASHGLNVRGDDVAPAVREGLALPILTSDQTLQETRRFAAARVPDVPAPESSDAWQAYAEETRKAALDRVVFRGPAQDWRKAWCKVELLDTIQGGSGYNIRKLRLEVLPDMWIPALLYMPEKLHGKVPVFLNVNGHDPVGKAADYKQARCIHMARNGIIALNLEWFGMGQLATAGFTHSRMNQLDLCGASGVAPFYLSMSRALDFLLSLENADPERVGVAGLSGGGWQTIFISSLDPRVTLCNPVAGYSSFKTRIDNFSDLGDSEQTPVDLGITADYAHLTAMLAPRAVLLTYNEKDNCCFASGHALEPLLQAALPVYKLLGQESRFRTHINTDPGTHNFLLDNRQALYAMIRDQWFAGNEADFPAAELPLDTELKSREVLDVPMPMMNQDFQTLALSLAESLPKIEPRPADEFAVSMWKEKEVSRLRNVVKPFAGTVSAEIVSENTAGELSMTQWKLVIGETWSVPVVEFSQGDPTKTAIVICDSGRKSADAHVSRLLQNDYRVLAMDPFNFGECSFTELAYLWSLMVSTVGERPLGIQSGEVLRVTEWAQSRHPSEPIIVVTDGPRCSAIGLVSAALSANAISAVEEHGALKSLKEIVQANYAFDKMPELFCAGLLEVTDLPHLRELIGQQNE